MDHLLLVGTMSRKTLVCSRVTTKVYEFLTCTSEMHGSSPRSHQSVDFNPGSPHLDGADFDPVLDPEAVEPQPQQDDIKVEYHPHSKIPLTIHRFVDFSRHRSMEDSVPRSTSPWEPFRTRLDFEVAEIALEAAMTKDQTNRLFNLLHRSACGKEAFTLQSHDEVRSFWEMASERFTPVSVSNDALCPGSSTSFSQA